jgi:hypothetical protein
MADNGENSAAPTVAPEAAPSAPAVSPLQQDGAASIEDAPVTDTPVQEVVQDTPDKTEAPKEEPPVVDDQKKDDAAQSAEPAPLPTFEPFTLPEGFQPDESLNEFTKDLAEFTRDNGLDAAKMQAFGQQLVDKYAARTQETLERYSEIQQAEQEKVASEWRTQLEKDPELGGNRLETTTQSLRQAVSKYAGSTDQVKEFQAAVETHKWGNHPALVRLINNMQNKIDSYEKETVRPLGAQSLVPKSKSMTEKFYGKR